MRMVTRARNAHGAWTRGKRLPGKIWFDVDVPEGEPSTWLTLIGMRVTAWWENL